MAINVPFWQSLTNLDAKWIAELSTALLTPLIVIIATYIAYQQWRVNKTRLDLDLYDRRLAIYKAVDGFYSDSFTHGAINLSLAEKLRIATAEARFLFPEEIEAHLETLHNQAMKAAMLRERLYPGSGEQGLPVGEARSQTVDEESQLVTDIQDRLRNESKRLFRRYLRLA